MRFLHTGDLHIGKKLHGYDLLEDQRKNLKDLLKIAEKEKVDALILAGDLYDRSVPPVEAIELFNSFIVEANLERKLPILAISGNHDSGTRLEVGAPWYSHTNFYLNTRLEQAFQPIEIENTQFFLLPYFEPIAARLYFEDENIRTISQAMEKVIPEIEAQFDKEKSHVLVAHFFAAGSRKTDSETKIEVGGLDSVPLDLLENFDYVALGHLHNRNALQHETIRYSGSPLKFSLSELNQKKGVWIVDLPELKTSFNELEPLHEMHQLEASFEELLTPSFYARTQRDDYLEILLTDRDIIPNMMNQLRQIYPRILSVERLYGRRQTSRQADYERIQHLSPQALIENFFTEVTGEEMTDKQESWAREILGDSSQTEGKSK